MKLKKALVDRYELILYTENTEHMELLARIIDNKISIIYDYIYIIHDKDTYTDDDFNEALINGREVEWSVGDKKKEHIHLYLYLNNDYNIDTVAEILGVSTHDLGFIYDDKHSLLYLLHRLKKDANKYQYNVEEVKGSKVIIDKLKTYLSQEELSNENTSVAMIYNFINKNTNYISFNELLNFCLINNLYSFYRRGFAVFKVLLDEHNNRYKK